MSDPTNVYNRLAKRLGVPTVERFPSRVIAWRNVQALRQRLHTTPETAARPGRPLPDDPSAGPAAYIRARLAERVDGSPSYATIAAETRERFPTSRASANTVAVEAWRQRKRERKQIAKDLST